MGGESEWLEIVCRKVVEVATRGVEWSAAVSGWLVVVGKRLPKFKSLGLSGLTLTLRPRPSGRPEPLSNESTR